MNQVYVTHVGAQTCFGTIAEAAAAYRCGISIMREMDNWPYFDEAKEEQFIVEFPAAGLNSGFDSLGRYLKLFGSGIEDLANEMSNDESNDNVDCFYLILKDIESFKYFSEFDHRFIKLAEAALQVSFELNKSFYIFFSKDKSSEDVLNDIKTKIHAGENRRIVFGIVDSLVETSAMQRLTKEGMLKTEDNPVGKMPGEAAVFILLSLDSNNNNAMLLSKVSEAQVVKSDNIDDIDMEKISADALTKAILEGISDLSDENNPGTIYTNFCGNPVDSHELSNSLTRISVTKPISHWWKEFPATSFGDVGEASIALNMALVHKAYARNYNIGNVALLVTQSDSLTRSAILLKGI